MTNKSKKQEFLLPNFLVFVSCCLYGCLLNACGPADPPLPTSTPSPSSTHTITSTASPSPTSSPTITLTPSPTPICVSTTDMPPGVEIELYGNYHTMGIIVSFGDIDIDLEASALVEYRTGSSPIQQGHPLSRVNENMFIGSLFWLEPATAYEIKVTLIDEGMILNCSMISAFGSTRIKITNHEPIHSLIVSPDGNGSECSMDNPCSLTTGISQAFPGDAIILRGGIYYEGDINLPRSGSEEAPILIQGAVGEDAILDGSDPVQFTWDARGDGVFETIVNAVEPTLVLADSQRLYRYQSYQDLVDLSRDLPGFFSQGYRVYVHLDEDSDPNEHNMVVGRRKYGFWINQDYIHIKNLTFRHYDVRWQRSGLYIHDGSNNLIQDCTFAHNGYGIILQGAANNNLIEGNEFYDSIYEWSWDAVKANHDNTGQGREAGGIYFNDPHPSGLQVMPRGTVIRRNRFHDLFDGFGICTFDTPAFPSNETDVYENHIYRAGDDGMEADGYCSNVRIFNNIFHDVLVGISLAPVQIGPTYVIGNLVYDIGRPRGCPFGKEGPCGGTGLKVQYGEPISGPIYLFHNTFDGGTKNYSAFIVEDAGWPMLVSRNNTWGSSRSGGLEVGVDDPLDFDYDNIFSGEDCLLIHWLGQDFSSFDLFKKTIKQEMNGMSVDPKFADMENGDYSLHPNSSLIDAGILIPGINHQFLGLSPDIGAFEYAP